METLTASTTGLIHLAAAIAALIGGTFVLVINKGTSLHKQIGYVYVFSMTIMLITAFMIYRLFNGFGIFHALGIISILTLAAGMYPILSRKHKNYIYLHFRFMYWSVIGLYGAFIAETMVRIPHLKIFSSDYKPTGTFYNITGISIGLVMLSAVIYFKKQKPVWLKKFNDRGINNGG